MGLFFDDDNKWKARRSARRIGLRDKGEIPETYPEKGIVQRIVHAKCYTPVRIGIDKQGQAHEYCWRCECLIGSRETPPDPGEEISDESEERQAVNTEAKVIQLPLKKR